DGFITHPGLGTLLKKRPIKTDEVLVRNVLRHNGITHLDALFVSHSHYDHALDVAYIANETDATLYGSPSTCNIGRGGGVKHLIWFRTDVRSTHPVGKRFLVTVLPSKHSRPTLVNNDLGQRIESPLVQPAKESDYKEGNTVDFLIRYDKGDESHHDYRTIFVKP